MRFMTFLAPLVSAMALAFMPAPAAAQCSGSPNANTFCAGPTTGSPGQFRARPLVPADLLIGSAVQAWDADLDALAALAGTNTIYYRNGADSWAAVSIGGLLSFTGGTLNIGDAELVALAGLTSAADKVPYFTGLGTAGVTDFTALARTLLGNTTASAMRSTLGVAIGADVQAYHINLAAFAGLTGAAGKVGYFTAAGTMAMFDSTSFGRSVLNAADAAALRVLAGAVIGTNVQAWDADLDCLAALSTTGLVGRTAAGTCAVRTITAPAAGITIANGDGVSGNPTFSLANDLAAVEGLSGTGIARRTGTDAWSVGTQVINAELANMGNGTFKCRVTAGSGAPEDCTPTQSTALLNGMVGDTGSGGTKGLVPPPGAGDAAAGKYLKADGTFAVPPGTGGGGSLADADRQNILLDRIYVSKSQGDVRRVVYAWATGLKSTTDTLRGISAGSSSNYDVTNSSVSGYVAPTVTAGSDQTATHTAGSASGNTVSASTFLSAGFESWRAFDKVIGSGSGAGTWITNAVTTGYLQYQFGSAKTIGSYQLASPNGLSTRMASAWTLKGSNTGSYTGEEVTLDTRSGEGLWTSGGETRTYSIASPASFAYYRLIVTANNGDGTYLEIDEMKLVSVPVTNNMTLSTAVQTADASVTSARVLLEFGDAASPSLNTDLTAEVTCNGGANWASASLSSVTSNSQAGRKVVETVDQGCTSGTTFAARIKTLNNKSVPVFGVSLTVH